MLVQDGELTFAELELWDKLGVGRSSEDVVGRACACEWGGGCDLPGCCQYGHGPPRTDVFMK